MNGATVISDSRTMPALVLHNVGDLRLEEVPVPEIRAGEALVRVHACGVCGSDIPRIYQKGTYRFPTICGHEFAGTVQAVAGDASALQPGDPVAVFPLLWCGQCAACERGQFAQCGDYGYLGSRSDGGFARFVAAPARNLLKVPPAVSLDDAAMTEPAAVALHALRRVKRCFAGETVAIFGAGPIGLMTALWAGILGFGRIILFDLIAEKLELARTLGFTAVFNSREHDPVAVVNELTHGAGVDLTIDAAGVATTLLHAMGAVRRGGTVIVLGNPSGDVTIPAPLLSQLMRREVSVMGTWNSDYSVAGNDDDWRTVLAAMATKQLNLSPLITHRVKLDQAIAMLDAMRAGSMFFSKVLLYA